VIPSLSNPMKAFPLRSFATSAALRFKFFSNMWARLPRSLSLCFLSVFAVTPFAAASTTWNGPTFNVSTAIPDNNDVGLISTQAVSATGITQIENVTVTINLTGGWDGDLYAYLVHDSGFSVLLNRAGRSASNPDGSAASGMVITFADSAASDIHTAIPMSGGSVSGTYQPDARITDPLAVLNTDPRPAMLSDFTGLDASGNWTLFIADQSAGEQSTLQSWSMTITGVPEPGVSSLCVIGVLFLLRRKR
jgi:subtilisin-like proprotein convertase family protein